MVEDATYKSVLILKGGGDFWGIGPVEVISLSISLSITSLDDLKSYS